jgi:hypothetical protein
MAKTYYLPAASALAVAFFVPVERSADDEVLAVEYLNYGIIGGIQITSLSSTLVVVLNVLVNGEFAPSLHAPREEGRGAYLRRGFPRQLPEYGCSFITVTDAPAAPDHIRSLCYGKPVTEVEVFTSHGNFVFEMSDG